MRPIDLCLEVSPANVLITIGSCQTSLRALMKNVAPRRSYGGCLLLNLVLLSASVIASRRLDDKRKGGQTSQLRWIASL